MRELNFRAFDKDYKNTFGVSSSRLKIERGMIYFNLDDYSWDNDGECGEHLIDIEVMPIMQFTGLKDKNGKDIYEGDIVSDGYDQKYEVAFEYGMFGIKYKNIISPINNNCTIIGNIYETPELLK